MTVLIYLLVVALTSIVAHWTLGADSRDSLLVGVAWPFEGMLLMVLGLGLIAASPVLLVLWIRDHRRRRNYQRGDA